MKRITYMRIKNGWTRAELARRVGMHPSSIGKIENGLEPMGKRGLKIAAALGWTGEVAALMDDVNIYAQAVKDSQQ